MNTFFEELVGLNIEDDYILQQSSFKKFLKGGEATEEEIVIKQDRLINLINNRAKIQPRSVLCKCVAGCN